VPSAFMLAAWGALRGADRARSHRRFNVLPLIHFIPYFRIGSVPLFLKRPFDRETLGADPATLFIEDAPAAPGAAHLLVVHGPHCYHVCSIF
jgi:hypothetical protein